MPNIVLTRIDNRLVHGQVATQWCGAIGANLILVANDEVAGNKLRQGLMDMAAPSYAAMRYWTIQKTIETIHKASARLPVLLLLTIRTLQPLPSCVSWVLSSRSVVFPPKLPKTSKSCSVDPFLPS